MSPEAFSTFLLDFYQKAERNADFMIYHCIIEITYYRVPSVMMDFVDALENYLLGVGVRSLPVTSMVYNGVIFDGIEKSTLFKPLFLEHLAFDSL